jgi:cell division protein FtsA
MSEWIYGLDIGTRKVMGLVGRRTAMGVEIIATETQEHLKRVMLDGQVHDIEGVANIVREITHALEKKIGEPLQEVAIAAAGRSLRVISGVAETRISNISPIAKSDVIFVESLALRHAVEKIGTEFCCVGYAPSTYRLDKIPFKTIEGHFGNVLEIEILATFLPKVVFESLWQVIVKSGLKISSLTLEPIAALEAVIPPDLRMLNLVLIDIGAGTSDLAVVNDGTISGFEMIPIAGDEISEFICKNWLVDFNQAEKIKKSFSQVELKKVESMDIFGKALSIEYAEFERLITDFLNEFTLVLMNKIIEMNNGKPDAIILVGGGSELIGLVKCLSTQMSMSERSIGPRRPNQNLDLIDRTHSLTETWGATPAGIMLIAARQKGLKIYRYFLNGIERALAYSSETLSVLELFSQLGLKLVDDKVENGKDLIYKLNGITQVVKGELAVPAVVKINQQMVSWSSLLPADAEIEFIAPKSGTSASLQIKNMFTQDFEIPCFLNGMATKVQMVVWINEKKSTFDDYIPSNAEIKTFFPIRLKDFLESQGYDLTNEISREILISINGEPRILTQKTYLLTVNGTETSLEYEIKKNDVIEFSTRVQSQYRIRDIINPPQNGQPLHVFVNGQPFTLTGELGKVYMNGRLVTLDEFIIDQANIVTYDGKTALGTVSSILAAMELPKPETSSQRLKLLVDNLPAGFTTEVRNGSELIIKFE